MSSESRGWDDVRPRQQSELVQVEIDGETIVYEFHSQTLHRLDQRGTLVWGCLDGTATVAEISRDIAEIFGADESSVRSDVEALVTQLHTANLLIES
jgi:hypothetical protein